MRFKKQFRYLKIKAQSLLTKPFPTLQPSAICIGAQKAGTTSMYNYLLCHPGVAASKIKEIDFFNCNSRFSHGYNFYHSHFPRSIPENNGKLTFDITPGYFGGAALAAKRIYDYNPNIRLIVLLRNPVTRAYSAWQMYRGKRMSDHDWFFKWVERCGTNDQHDFVRRPSSFGQNFRKDISDEFEAIKSGQNIEMPILRLGMYYQNLKYYFDYFQKNQILVILSEDLKKDTRGELCKIEKFVGLEPYSWTQEQIKPSHVGTYKDSMPQNDYVLLKSFYQEENAALFDLIEKEFEWD